MIVFFLWNVNPLFFSLDVETGYSSIFISPFIFSYCSMHPLIIIPAILLCVLSFFSHIFWNFLKLLSSKINWIIGFLLGIFSPYFLEKVIDF